jgi:hypothetical protein
MFQRENNYRKLKAVAENIHIPLEQTENSREQRGGGHFVKISSGEGVPKP